MSIPFTQFLMPNGRQKAITIDRPEEIEAKAHRIIAAGYAFEIEMLMTGAISLEIINRPKERVIAGEICANGPPVPIAVDKMVNDAFATIPKRFREMKIEPPKKTNMEAWAEQLTKSLDNKPDEAF